MVGRQRRFRKRAHSEEAEEAGDPSSAAPQDGQPEVDLAQLERIKMLQKQRKRGTGTDASLLATGSAQPALLPDDDSSEHPSSAGFPVLSIQL